VSLRKTAIFGGVANAGADNHITGHDFGVFEMRSLLFTEFGIPDAECDIEPDFHPQFRVPYLFFRSPGNPLVGLDLTGASQLRQKLAHSGDTAKADEIGRLIQKARELV
jgi:hypothetical protein